MKGRPRCAFIDIDTEADLAGVWGVVRPGDLARPLTGPPLRRSDFSAPAHYSPRERGQALDAQEPDAVRRQARGPFLSR